MNLLNKIVFLLVLVKLTLSFIERLRKIKTALKSVLKHFSRQLMLTFVYKHFFTLKLKS